MPEDWINAGAIAANTKAIFSLKDKATAPVGFMLDVRTVAAINDSPNGNPTVRLNARQFKLARGRSSDLTPGGRIETIEVTADAVAIASGELQFLVKGEELPHYSRRVA